MEEIGSGTDGHVGLFYSRAWHVGCSPLHAAQAAWAGAWDGGDQLSDEWLEQSEARAGQHQPDQQHRGLDGKPADLRERVPGIVARLGTLDVFRDRDPSRHIGDMPNGKEARAGRSIGNVHGAGSNASVCGGCIACLAWRRSAS